MAKAVARVMKFDRQVFQPRFEYGDQAQAVQICGESDGSELASGFVRMIRARIPWTVQYDEIILVLEGEVRIQIGKSGNDVLIAGPMDTIWLPSGTQLIYESDKALLFYAIHPSNWASKA